MPEHLPNLTPEELAARLADLGQPAYRATQVLEWVWRKHATDFEAMSNLPKALRADLAERLAILSGTIRTQTRSDDDVTKLLLAWPDGQEIETVLIPTASRATACVSTQAGCGMGCVFCASGMDGLARNLTAGEIVEQVLQLRHATGRDVTNVVFMGMGEPLANYDATVAAVRTLIDPKRGGLSARRVTVSTVGLPEQIRRLASEDLPITLAISLHAPDDDLRSTLMPVATRWPIADVLDAARSFYAARHREVTLEYTLLRGINDTPACADALADLAGPLRCNVNLIRYNAVPDRPFRPPADQDVHAFAERLRRRGVNAQIRRSRGRDARAACGQLRRGHEA